MKTPPHVRPCFSSPGGDGGVGPDGVGVGPLPHSRLDWYVNVKVVGDGETEVSVFVVNWLLGDESALVPPQVICTLAVRRPDESTYDAMTLLPLTAGADFHALNKALEHVVVPAFI
jgi:hypothetical protein